MLRICEAFFLALTTERDRHHRWRAFSLYKAMANIDYDL
jgi:hypothetical protein